MLRALIAHAILFAACTVAPASNTQLTPATPPGERHFEATDDTFVKSRYPRSNYNRRDAVRVRQSGDRLIHGYLRFEIDGLRDLTVRRATLRMYVTNGSRDGGTAYRAASADWKEETLTFVSAPGAVGPPLDSAGAVAPDTWVHFDVTEAITGDGPIAFVLTSTSSNSVYYDAGDNGGEPPTLILEVDDTGDGDDDGPTCEPRTCQDSCGVIDDGCGADLQCPPCPEGAQPSIWLSASDLEALPASGPAWDNLFSAAQVTPTTANLADQNDKTDTSTVAKALVYAKLREVRYARQVRDTLASLVSNHPLTSSESWDWLGVLRSLGSYAIAADLISLSDFDPTFDRDTFRPWLLGARDAIVEGGRGSVVSAQEKRPNNFGTHGSASRIAVALYLKDAPDLARAITVFKGYLGDRSSYASFKYGDDLSWQADPNAPVGINPPGATIEGYNVDGVPPDDQRRSTSFSWPPVKTNYAWEALQGVVTAAEMLHRAGYDSYQWSDRAIFRAVRWLHTTTFSDGESYAAQGDDIWQVWIINKRYGTTYPAAVRTRPGKMVGWTDWSHQ